MALLEPVTFLRQTFSSFHTTGAIAPSSSALARAMVKSLPMPVPDNFQVLEVGAGTGSFTSALAAKMNGSGHLHAWEINPTFAAHLESRAATDPNFAAMRSRFSVKLGNVMDLKTENCYDAIVSGLPFNNFTPDVVRGFLEHFKKLLKPNGTLSFFEYAGIRPLQQPFVGRARRERLKGIAAVVDSFAAEYQFDAQIVWWNIPPARARHLRFGKTE